MILALVAASSESYTVKIQTPALGRRGFVCGGISAAALSLKRPVAIASSDEDISYDAFTELLFRGDASMVRFTGPNGEEVYVTTKSGDTRRVLGVPAESPYKVEGPFKTVARVRDAKVPYTIDSYDLTSFRKVGCP